MSGERVDLLVVGGGPAGLSHAYWRRRAQPALRVLVAEKAPRAGGWVRTELREGYVCEVGPQGYRPCAAADELLAALGIEADVVPARATAKLRWVARDGQLYALPLSPRELLATELLSRAGKLRLLAEPLQRRGTDAEESLAAFVGRRLGRETVPLAEAMASGVFAGDAAALELASAFPAAARWEREHGSLLRGLWAQRKARRRGPSLCTLRGGMERLPRALAGALGGALRTAAPVTALARSGDGFRARLGGDAPGEIEAGAVVLALPAAAAAALVRPLHTALASELAAIPFAGVANVWLGFAADRVRERLRGFGFLLPAAERSPVLGALYVSSLFDGHAPDGTFLVRVMLGGARWPEALALGPQAMAELAETALRRYTGVDAPVAFRHVACARAAIPQYVRGHRARLQRIRAHLEEVPGLTLRGSSYDSVALVGQLGS